MKNTTETGPIVLKIELNEQILFSKNQGVFVGTIVEIKDKAIKVDYAWESAWSNGKSLVVYTYSCWIPKSVLIADDHGDITVKKWFIEKLNGVNIKKYFLDNGVKKFI